MDYPLIDFGGRGRVVHLAPANGFPLNCYQPIVDELVRTHRVVAIPPRALWDDPGRPPNEPGSWETVADDIARGLEERGLGPAILVGHSFGGVASLIAAVRYRSLVLGLCLLDPTILADEVMETFRTAKATGWAGGEHPIAEAARERRSRFRDPAEAFRFWRSKALFADWSDEALGRYVEGQLRPDPGGGYALRWSPEWEVHYYHSFYSDTWAEVAALDPELPVLVVAGETSEAFQPAQRDRFARLRPGSLMVVIPGHGHLFPQSAPVETARVIRAWVDQLGQGRYRKVPDQPRSS